MKADSLVERQVKTVIGVLRKDTGINDDQCFVINGQILFKQYPSEKHYTIFFQMVMEGETNSYNQGIC